MSGALGPSCDAASAPDGTPVLMLGSLRTLAVDGEAMLYIGPGPLGEASPEREVMEGLYALAKEGRITAIVDLNADDAEKTAVDGRGLVYHGIRIDDDGAPLTPAILKSASRLVRELMDSGHRVCLHCPFGPGRSPTVAAAYLISHKGMSALPARAHVEGLHARWLGRGIWTGYDARFPGRLQEFEQQVRRETSGGDRG